MFKGFGEMPQDFKTENVAEKHQNKESADEIKDPGRRSFMKIFAGTAAALAVGLGAKEILKVLETHGKKEVVEGVASMEVRTAKDILFLENEILNGNFEDSNLDELQGTLGEIKKEVAEIKYIKEQGASDEALTIELKKLETLIILGKSKLKKQK